MIRIYVAICIKEVLSEFLILVLRFKMYYDSQRKH